MSGRREFLKAFSSALLVPTVAWPSKAGRLPLAFSTLGCPGWEWGKILDFAGAHGFAAIELRCLEGILDLPAHRIFAPERIEQTKREISASKLRIACLSSSATLYVAGQEDRARELKDARRFIDLAARLGAPYVRIFGGKSESDMSPMPSVEQKARVAAGLSELGKYAGPRGVTVLIESHDHFTASSTLHDVLRMADSKHVALLWDANNTFADANEEPEFTVRQLGPWIRHTHLKDSVGSGEDRRYVLTGRGEVPIPRQLKSLQSIRYQGFYCFEWEKLWHPEIDDPEIAIADFARVLGIWLGNARAGCSS